MLLLIYFILLFILALVATKTLKSVVFILIFLQIISIGGAVIIGYKYPVNTIFKVVNGFITAAILTMTIAPWAKFKRINEIFFLNQKKLESLTLFLMVVSMFAFIALAVTAIYVHIMVVDINYFKYGSGVSVKFYYNTLPINTKILILSNYLYYFSYFLIPLHIYYLGKKKYFYSFICFLGSLNSVLFGLTFFSRATIVNYSLIYISFLFMLYDTLEIKQKRFVKVAAILMGIAFSLYFMNVTRERFTNDKWYQRKIVAKSDFEDPVLYSYFDYIAQWYPHNMYLLEKYRFEKFNGQTALQPVLGLMGHYRIINYDTKDYNKLVRKIWPLHYYTFNGLVAYSIYDFGYVVSSILCFLYAWSIYKMRPREHKISLLHLFYLVLLIQIPLMSIFYSAAGEILIPFLLLIPIHIFLRTKLVFNPVIEKS